MEGFIKLNRKMLNWEWYDDINTFKVFIHCLFKANWMKKRWHGIEVEPGQFVTSLSKLSEETHLSVRQVRTCLEHLENTGELTSKSYPKYRVITINKWGDYQTYDKQATKYRQGSDKVATTTKERKERKKERNNTVSKFGDYKQRDYDYKKLEKDIK